MITKKNIAVFGLGYVGTSLSVLLAKNNNVYGIDIDNSKVETLNKGLSPITDDHISKYLNEEELSLQALSKLSEINCNIDYFIIATPTTYDEELKAFNTSSIEKISKEISRFQKKSTVVIKSTVPIGFTSEIQKSIKNINFIFSPEFLREGMALYDNLYPSRIIVGRFDDIGQKFADLLVGLCEKDEVETILMESSEAEAVKLFSNSYLAMRVAFFNELDSFAISKELSADSIINGVCLDNRIGNFYNNPSFGYGGYCLPKDTKQLLNQFDNVPNDLISAIVSSNKARKNYVTTYILNLKPQVVGIYRIIMKSKSDNFRESAVLDIMETLIDEGIKVIIYEPLLDDIELMNAEIVNDLDSFKSKSDLVLANRKHTDLKDISDKVFTRDIFKKD
tara:strand:- start:758 stop:1936 length:1179 start_codon:yes stop_codon:yes gene_type:complete